MCHSELCDRGCRCDGNANPWLCANGITASTTQVATGGGQFHREWTRNSDYTVEYIDPDGVKTEYSDEGSWTHRYGVAPPRGPLHGGIFKDNATYVVEGKNLTQNERDLLEFLKNKYDPLTILELLTKASRQLHGDPARVAREQPNHDDKYLHDLLILYPADPQSLLKKLRIREVSAVELVELPVTVVVKEANGEISFYTAVGDERQFHEVLRLTPEQLAALPDEKLDDLVRRLPSIYRTRLEDPFKPWSALDVFLPPKKPNPLLPPRPDVLPREWRMRLIHRDIPGNLLLELYRRRLEREEREQDEAVLNNTKYNAEKQNSPFWDGLSAGLWHSLEAVWKANRILDHARDLAA